MTSKTNRLSASRVEQLARRLESGVVHEPLLASAPGDPEDPREKIDGGR